MLQLPFDLKMELAQLLVLQAQYLLNSEMDPQLSVIFELSARAKIS